MQTTSTPNRDMVTPRPSLGAQGQSSKRRCKLPITYAKATMWPELTGAMQEGWRRIGGIEAPLRTGGASIASGHRGRTWFSPRVRPSEIEHPHIKQSFLRMACSVLESAWGLRPGEMIKSTRPNKPFGRTLTRKLTIWKGQAGK